MMVFSQGEKLLFKFKSPYLMMCQLIEEKIASLKHFVLFFSFFHSTFGGPVRSLVCAFVCYLDFSVSLSPCFFCLFVCLLLLLCVCVCVCVFCAYNSLS